MELRRTVEGHKETLKGVAVQMQTYAGWGASVSTNEN
jgi:hypothetical protein